MLNDHVDEVISAVEGLSRTARTGMIDLSSSQEKAGQVDTSHDLESVEDRIRQTNAAVRASIGFLGPLTPADASIDLLLEVNRLLSNAAVMAPGFRVFRVSRFRYLEPEQVKADCEKLARKLKRLAPSRDSEYVTRVLFDVHWHVNLRGHYFTDACARTAVVVGCWATEWVSGLVFPLPSREAYLNVANADAPWTAWRELLMPAVTAVLNGGLAQDENDSPDRSRHCSPSVTGRG